MLDKSWLEAAFILLLVGYGTKMGLAPMHTWKPDAYGEAPGVVGALLAGVVTNCAFLALLRIHHICQAAGESPYTGRLMIFIGLLSMAVAAVFMVGQRDIKRMLAYSSVEHMGILVIGAGIGGPAMFGALLHMINNGMTKGVLFLSAGNIHRAYGSKTTDEVRGAMSVLPLSGTLFLLGFFAITGSPPFGPFVSEFTILNGALDQRPCYHQRLLSVPAAGHFHRHGPHRADGRAGKAPARQQTHRLSRWVAHRIAHPPVAWHRASPRCPHSGISKHNASRCGAFSGGSAMTPALATLGNGRAVDRSAVPELQLDEFQQAILVAVERDQRVVALFGMAGPEPEAVQFHVVLADDQQSLLQVARTRVSGDSFPSLTDRCPQVHLFEREIGEQFGLRARRPSLVQAGPIPPVLAAGARRLGTSRK